ncbi:DUF3048 domain-containing protein [Ureibacillus thermophilus]|uniref:DUF3048 domain-containing protein n=1 Tax=Ureibacillus thermophilus TaxID=367743 RepID=A0A4P6UR43_9BACL|nr:DUF3048 domain-containing protein [Ureibacillus thermophilus]QBK24521.1 DUF3048 domain-containing protein [Ureibacillus thermophilus]
MISKKALFCVFASVSLLAACGDKEKGTEKIEEPVKPTEEVEEKVELYPTPFTGELREKESTLRPIIATINNHPAARPQSGIASADVVYEMLAEGDVTRFLALYQSEIPEKIGPIRSARSYFVELAEGLDAFYIAHGYSPEAKQMLESGVVDNINGMNYDGTYFKRSKDRVAPHNSYFITDNLEAVAEKVNASLLYQKKVSYTYYDEEESPKKGVQADQVHVRYSKNENFNCSYSYDSTNNTYTRSSGGTMTTDLLTGEPLKLSNVLIFEMEHTVIDNKGRREIDIHSGGFAYLFQQGMMRVVHWENIDGVLTAVENDGSKVKLVPGKTWVHFVPTNPGITTSVTYTSSDQQS